MQDSKLGPTCVDVAPIAIGAMAYDEPDVGPPSGRWVSGTRDR